MKLKYLLCFLLVIVLSTSSLAVTIPAPSTVTCPTFLDGASGMDTITNSNTNSYGSRNFNYQINGNPNAVIFAWHSLGGFPPDALAIIAPYATNAIIVAPSNGGAQYAWNTGDDVYPNPEDNPDIILFDDILSCLVQTYNVDLDRIWTYGFSAGAMWSSYLGQHRSNDLAAVVAHSGGIQYGGENKDQVLTRHVSVIKKLPQLYSAEVILLVGHGRGLNTLLASIGYPPTLKRGQYLTIPYTTMGGVI